MFVTRQVKSDSLNRKQPMKPQIRDVNNHSFSSILVLVATIITKTTTWPWMIFSISFSYKTHLYCCSLLTDTHVFNSLSGQARIWGNKENNWFQGNRRQAKISKCANVFPHTYLAKTISIASWLVFVPLNSPKESFWLQNKVFNVGLLYLITPVVEKIHWKEAMQNSEYIPRRSKAWPWDEKSL